MQTLRDIQKVFRSPVQGFREILESRKIYSSQWHLSFVLFMHLYFLFLPSYLIVINILVLLMIFILSGMLYYFAQECFLIYKESHRLDIQDDKFFYTIAYCFAIANIPGFILNLFLNIVSISFSDNFIVGLAIAVVLNFIALIFCWFYPLKFMQVITGKNKNIGVFFGLIASSFIVTCKQQLGFKAVKEIFFDFQGQSL